MNSNAEFFVAVKKQLPLISDRLEYEGIARQVLHVHTLEAGAINTHPLNRPGSPGSSVFIGEDGKTVEKTTATRHLYPSEFQIYAKPAIPSKLTLTDVDRLLDKITYQLMLQEDQNVLRLLYAAAKLSKNIIKIKALDKPTAEKLQKRFKINKFLLNRQELGDLKKYPPLDFDPLCQRDLLMTGIFGYLNSTAIYVTAGINEPNIENICIPEGMIIGVPDHVGVMPIRTKLTIIKEENGFKVVEQISQYIPDISNVVIAIKPGCKIPKWLKD